MNKSHFQQKRFQYDYTLINLSMGCWQETKIDDPRQDQIPYKEEGFGFDLPWCIEQTMIHI